VVSRWLEILERLHAIFRIAPFGAPTLRAVKKVRKHYHFDWSVVRSPGLRFENLVAGHLLKWVHHQQDTQGLDLELRYFRDRDDREVDFVVTDRSDPVLIVECKSRDVDVDRSLRYLTGKFPKAEAWQISARGSKDFVRPDGIHVAPAERLLERLV
jgi:predicted AAA+ superfamily ATPase